MAMEDFRGSTPTQRVPMLSLRHSSRSTYSHICTTPPQINTVIFRVVSKSNPDSNFCHTFYSHTQTVPPMSITYKPWIRAFDHTSTQAKGLCPQNPSSFYTHLDAQTIRHAAAGPGNPIMAGLNMATSLRICPPVRAFQFMYRLYIG